MIEVFAAQKFITMNPRQPTATAVAVRVLEQDPYEVGPDGLKDIPIWGTVFEGKPVPLMST